MKFKKGSGILVVILSAIVFSIYAVSTYKTIEHFNLMQTKYETSIIKIYEYDNIDEIYNNLIDRNIGGY
ncbi:MAG: hypothetical protein RSE41_01735 [Clostridia bacterium]